MKLLGRTHFFVLGGFAALTPLAIDMYLPALPLLGSDLSVSVDRAAQTVSVFLFGLAGGQLVFGPLSDRLGRKPIILAGLLLFILSAAVAATTGDFHILLAARLVQAIGASSVWVAGRAVVSDVLDKTESARFYSLLALISGLAPVLAPMLGAAVIAIADWRTIFWIMAAFGVLLATGLFALFESRSPETAANARNEHPIRTFRILLSNRGLLGYLLAAMFNSGGFLAYVANSSVVLVTGYGLTPTEFSLLFGLNSISLVAAAQLNRAMLKARDTDQMLRISAANSVIIAALLFLFAATEIGGIWTLGSILLLVAGSRSPLQANTLAGGLAVDPLRTGSISALFGAASFAAGAFASWIASLVFDGTARGLCVVVGICWLGTAASIYLLIPPGEKRRTT